MVEIICIIVEIIYIITAIILSIGSCVFICKIFIMKGRTDTLLEIEFLNGIARQKIKDKITEGVVIGVDFDSTLCNSHYPNCGEPIQDTIDFIKWAKSKGATIVLWTCREGEYLEMALDWCKEYGVPIDYANCNVPERMALWNNSNPRKIAADIYIDDKFIDLNYLRELMID